MENDFWGPTGKDCIVCCRSRTKYPSVKGGVVLFDGCFTCVFPPQIFLLALKPLPWCAGLQIPGGSDEGTAWSR